MTLYEVKKEVESVLSLMDQLAGRLRKIVDDKCDHHDSYVEKDSSMTGEVVCRQCGYRREWNAY